ncbi:hypothetical protein [Streptomyces sp. ISL-100]|uniref:hypothetical protein n=1 Tax=Streptomyces sp. ISL-100 TaxID=2819173 RepID=UPI001BE8234D|nr:hypothetical protein [Streptomyces sp. ISL-100]MBT2398506.1 hypothetical protein [Streptomyces sp. ISL-100]
MTSATFMSGPSARRNRPAGGATAIGAAHPSHRIGEALRAVKVFVGAAFRVAVLGEYAQEAGVSRHRH